VSGLTCPERRVHLTYDGSKTQRVDIDGHAVMVSTEKRNYGDANKGDYGDPAKTTFTATDRAGREAAVAFLQEVATAYENNRRDNAADIYVGTRWGDWQRVREIPPRPLESVVLAGDLRERLVDDLTRFMAEEETYVRLGLPYHRGYLLHGPAGTGKTSIAKVLAGHLGLDIYVLPLSSMQADTDLSRMLANVGSRAMLLLEDIDVVHAAKSRDDTTPGISLSGLLNALDGVATPHGSIHLMTTNKLDVLDEALTRPGRADQTVLIDYLDDEQLGRLVASIYGDNLPGQIPWLDGRQLTPAAVVEAIKAHLDDPEAGFRAVKALVESTEPVHA
jgi:chaperone BCS1